MALKEELSSVDDLEKKVFSSVVHRYQFTCKIELCAKVVKLKENILNSSMWFTVVKFKKLNEGQDTITTENYAINNRCNMNI